MTIQQLASKLAVDEKGKSQAKIGDIRQILKLLAEEIEKNPAEVIGLLCKYAKAQGKRKK